MILPRVRSSTLVFALVAAGCTGEISSIPGRPDPASTPGGPSGSIPAGVTLGTSEVPGPRLLRQLTLSEYHSTVEDLLRIGNPDTSDIPPDVAHHGYTTNAVNRFIDSNNIDKFASIADSLADRAVGESYVALVPCQSQDMACAEMFVDTFRLRAFRRPLTTEETARYLALFDAGVTGGDFKVGVSLVIRAMLVSPYFLMRSELGIETAPGRFTLTPFEVASALSYTYWGTMPDDALFAAAGSGALSRKGEIESQARRLLAAPRGRARIAAFAGEWLEASRAYVATKDPKTYPALKDAATSSQIVDSMKGEMDAFFTSVAFDSSKKFSELFSADFTFVNDRLATFYGLPQPGTGETFTKVSVGSASQRGGLLTAGMFLFGHAHPDQSSPTQRGHLIRANIFCNDVPPPPPGVDATVKPAPPGKTGRQQIEALTGSGLCETCHNLMNPIGFGLEAFDGAAQLRTLDNGEPVDTSGAINGLTAGPAITFNGPRELATIVARDPGAQACFATQYYRYVRGFDPGQTGQASDAVATDLLGKAFTGGNLDLPELFVQVALQDSFVVRRSVEVLNP